MCHQSNSLSRDMSSMGLKDENKMCAHRGGGRAALPRLRQFRSEQSQRACIPSLSTCSCHRSKKAGSHFGGNGSESRQFVARASRFSPMNNPCGNKQARDAQIT